jgi:undecaprenyl-diphosphatase
VTELAAWLQAVILGVVQGLTEFLPVSSSGHLVLFQTWMGDNFFAQDQPLLFVLALHVGTLVPVLWFYRDSLRDIVASPWDGPGPAESGAVAWLRDHPARRMAALVLLGTVPTGLIGILMKDHFEALFNSPDRVAVALLITGAVLFGTRGREGAGDDSVLTLRNALIIGFAQGLAITPGISRSGTTIAVALFLGMNRELAARYSFLLSIPAICGAVVLEMKDGIDFAGTDWNAVGAGFFASMVVGYLALIMLVALVKRGGLHHFAWYLWPVGVGVLVLT